MKLWKWVKWGLLLWAAKKVLGWKLYREEKKSKWKARTKDAEHSYHHAKGRVYKRIRDAL